MIDDFVKEGYTAYFDGLSKSDNPYPSDPTKSSRWLKGFRIGEREDIDQDPDGN
jgi:ribosome modulation factor